MLYLQPTLRSYDYWIALFQERFYNNYMLPVLGLNDSNSMCCGRVSRNKSIEKGTHGYIPELFWDGEYISSNGLSDRGGLFFETGKFISFFGHIGNKKNGADYTAKFELIVFTDMSIITPNGITSSTQRLDEVLLAEIETFITVNGCSLAVKESTFDIDKIVERYSAFQKIDTLKLNMSNGNNDSSFCALKIIVEIPYDPAQIFGDLQPFQNNMVQQSLVFFIKDGPDPSRVINVGNNVYIYQEYAPTDTLIVTRTDNDKAYFTGYNVQAVILNNTPDTLASIIGVSSSGMYDRTGQGDPFGLNDGDFVSITFTNIN